MSVKVSVVVPTYAPGDLIGRVVRSLDAQTMPAGDFEVIFVDDGSPGDDTWSRLESIPRRPRQRADRTDREFRLAEPSS